MDGAGLSGVRSNVDTNSRTNSRIHSTSATAASGIVHSADIEVSRDPATTATTATNYIVVHNSRERTTMRGSIVQSVLDKAAAPFVLAIPGALLGMKVRTNRRERPCGRGCRRYTRLCSRVAFRPGNGCWIGERVPSRLLLLRFCKQPGYPTRVVMRSDCYFGI